MRRSYVILVALIGAITFYLFILPFVRKSSSFMGAITTQWLDQQLASWQTSTIRPIGFSGQLTRASYLHPQEPYNTDQVLDSELSMLTSLGVNQIRIDIDGNWFIQNNSQMIARLDALISKVRQAGKLLVIADCGATYYRTNKVPWSQFKTLWTQRVQTIASRYKPDYYIVIKEAGFYAGMISDALYNLSARSPSDWSSLATNLSQTVKSVSPLTRCGVTIPASSSFDQGVLSAVVRNSQSVDFIGFDIYGIAGFVDCQDFLQKNGSGNRDIWIAEAWSITGKHAFDSSRSALDALWIKTVFYFCQQVNAIVLNPFFSDCFASYTQPNTSSEILSMYSKKQPVGTEFQNIIRGQP